MRLSLWAGVLTATLCVMLSAPASALNWRVSPSASSITFEYTEDGQRATGSFQRFGGAGAFDPQRPSTARLSLSINVGSLQLGDRFRTDFVRGPVWFDTARRPEATFVLDRLEPAGGDRFEARGSLTIKGVTRPVSTPVTVQINGRQAVATGALRFNRFDFNVGDRSSLFVDIGDDVTVRFRITAERI